MNAIRERRLPGIRFETQALGLREALPRMDIPVFVGFAASGPLNFPVAIDDLPQFEEIFGPDAVLPWDAAPREPARSFLGGTVRSFFANGGRRCWIVRVAGKEARSNCFPVPGLVRVDPAADDPEKKLEAAFALARSKGSWSDDLVCATGLREWSFPVTNPIKVSDNVIKTPLPLERAPRKGDLLRVDCSDGLLLFTAVTGVESQLVGASDIKGSILQYKQPVWLQCVGKVSSPQEKAPFEELSIRVGIHPRTEILSNGQEPTIPANVVSATVTGEVQIVVQVSDAVKMQASQPGERFGFYLESCPKQWQSFPKAWLFELKSIPDPKKVESALEVRLSGHVFLPITKFEFQRAEAAFAQEPDIRSDKSEYRRKIRRLQKPSNSVELVFPNPASKNDFVEWVIEVDAELAREILPGMLVRVEIEFDLKKETWWIPVERVSFIQRNYSSLVSKGLLQGRAFKWRDAPGSDIEAEQASVLEFDLNVRQNSGSNYLLRNLGFTKDHVRYWNDLPDDEQYYGIGANLLHGNGDKPDFGQTPDGKRFPLAGADVSDALFLPLGIDSSLARRLGPCPNKEVSSIRDGLATFEPGIFLDEDMTGVSLDQLMSRADYLRYLSPRPRSLRGIHAALGWQECSIIEEATLIAVPDAVHCPWNITPGPAQQIQESATPSTSEPSETPESPPTFENCVPLALDSPVLSVMSISDGKGDFRLNWNEISQATSYRLQESVVSGFDEPVEIYAGESTTVTLFGRNTGTRFYRVRAEFGQVRSTWSKALTVSVDDFIPLPDHNPETLLIVQRALMRMCAARGDLLAVLSLPLHYDEAEAISHAESLRRFNTSPDAGDEAFAFHEAQALSYGALYYPWIVTGNGDGGLKSLSPEGAACGVFARRAIARGAWVAPANEPLREVLALLPRVAPNRLPALQLAQINVIRQDPRGFLSLSADTLSEDIDVRPINVRRLLILLRRLATKHGAIYVFEPNNGVFRRTVQGGFEALLYPLFEQGAFAGKTREAAYRVNTGTEINTTTASDQGRFYVELQVAPSLPMTFLTVRLVQTGDRLTVSEGR